MDVVALGTVALDTIETPFGRKERVLGGSATYFSLASRLFADTGIVAVVGADFPAEHKKLLSDHGIDLAGLEESDGKTFHWEGAYEYDMNQAHTRKTELNVLATFQPKIPDHYRDCSVLFLANTDPAIQLACLEDVNPAISIADTMDYWIESKRGLVSDVFAQVDVIVINDGEARQYADTPNLVEAGRNLLDEGVRNVVIKKGEHGSLLFTKESVFSHPAYPLERVVDPTGAGDSFGGGLAGYLATQKNTDDATLRKAIVYGTAVASHTVEDFSVAPLTGLSADRLEERIELMRQLTRFE